MIYIEFDPLEDKQMLLNADVEKGEELKCLDSGLSPAEQVQQAKGCLPSLDTRLKKSTSDESFHRWTIMDYSRAYESRQITPLMVSWHSYDYLLTGFNCYILIVFRLRNGSYLQSCNLPVQGRICHFSLTMNLVIS